MNATPKCYILLLSFVAVLVVAGLGVGSAGVQLASEEDHIYTLVYAQCSGIVTHTWSQTERCYVTRRMMAPCEKYYAEVLAAPTPASPVVDLSPRRGDIRNAAGYEVNDEVHALRCNLCAFGPRDEFVRAACARVDATPAVLDYVPQSQNYRVMAVLGFGAAATMSVFAALLAAAMVEKSRSARQCEPKQGDARQCVEFELQSRGHTAPPTYEGV